MTTSTPTAPESTPTLTDEEMCMAMKTASLRKIEIVGFRPFQQKVALENLARVNIVAGVNNVGKTALFRPLRRLTLLDQRYVRRVAMPAGAGRYGMSHYVEFLAEDFFVTASTLELALTFEAPAATCVIRSEKTRPYGEGPFYPSDFDFCGAFTRSSRDVTQTVDNAGIVTNFALRIVFVPEKRKVLTTLDTPPDHQVGERLYDGSTVFRDLLKAKLKGGLQKTEELLGKFLNQTAKIELEVDPPKILLKLDQDREARDLRNLGHGIEQLLIFACAMTLATPQNPVVLFEEPEVGLHPRILRQFLNVLTEEQDSQFFLTTHSNHLVDFVHDNVKCFHLRKTQTGPQVESTDGPTLQMLSDLGVRSSSLMQANAVLWVEGPSDAMYIRKWLEVFGGDHKLIEHVDYTFAFFGGALLKHYSVEPDGTKQVALNPIHPGWFFIADSDRSNATDPLKKTYLNEFATRAGNERLWITKRKEIESYLTDDELRTAFGATERSEKVAHEHDGYESLAVRLAGLGVAGSHAESKVALARKVLDTNQFTTDRQDLKASIERIVDFIKRCSKGVPAKELDVSS